MDDLMYDVEWMYEGNTFTATVHADHGKALLDRLKAGGAENVTASRIDVVRGPVSFAEDALRSAFVSEPGDTCLMLGNGRVQHFSCDMYADGTITNVLTGKKEN